MQSNAVSAEGWACVVIGARRWKRWLAMGAAGAENTSANALRDPK
jgi:hypothetical protein